MNWGTSEEYNISIDVEERTKHFRGKGGVLSLACVLSKRLPFVSL